VQKLRVGFDYDAAVYGKGGIARYTKDLVEGLVSRENIELILIGKEANSIPHGDNIINYCHGLSRVQFRLYLLIWNVLGIRCFSGWPILDVFHGTDFAFPPVGAGARLVVVNIHDIIPLKWPEEVSWKHRLYFRIFCYLVKKTEVPVIVPSVAVANDVRDWLGLPESRINMVHYGVRMSE
jgi:glycosyltransferase involved in cell wall biosynthesis